MLFPTVFSELIAYNMIPIAALTAISFAPHISDGVASALRATLSYPFHINNQEIQLGVSIGVAKNNGEKDLLLRADNAMYKAKREGLGVCRL